MEKRILLQEGVVRALRDLLGQEISRVHADVLEVALSWPDGHYRITPFDELAASQNTVDEAITVALETNEGPFRSGSQVSCALEGCTLSAVWVAETVLYFTDEEEYSEGRRAYARVRYWLHKLAWYFRGRPEEGEVDLVLEEVRSRTVSAYEEIVAHPDRLEDLREMDRPLNFVQAGVVLDFEGLCLPAFSRGNGFGFPIRNGWPMSCEEIREKFGEHYRFVRLGSR